MTPAFRHIGGKARLRKWLVSNFPKDGRIYVEPFAGKGNVLYESKQRLYFKAWILSDVDVRFLQSVKLADLSQLPETVDRETFHLYSMRASSGCLITSLIEPRITFAGKGYAAGFSGSSGTHVGYSRQCYKAVCEKARELLDGVDIVQQDWKYSLVGLGLEDFVYLDPPYFGTKSSYANIDHDELVWKLNSASYRWALSGYENEVYKSLRYVRKMSTERNSEIKSSNSRGFQSVTETLWMNY